MNGEFSASPIAICTRHAPLRNSQEEVIPDNSFHLTKGWFQGVQPLTKSITPELRKYDFVQESQVPMVSDEPHHIRGQVANCMKQDFKQMSNSCNVNIAGMPNQRQTFMSNSDSSAPFDTAITTSSTLGSVLSLLMGL
ncbi:hypothetical protein HPP92_022727 [Vanilla planifolia]|uniref:Uncharacterized protein n=1 Tax=Vanilla planifolia TaxID=51239 RepID=A0A835UDW7_VANPL|nr:hypothetical protein HPP92_022727 [Vanilla planifolia]